MEAEATPIEAPPPGAAQASRRRSAGRPAPRRLGPRRRYVIHRASQLRTAWIVAGSAFGLLFAFNVALHAARTRAVEALTASFPAAASLFEAQSRFESVLLAAASALLVAGVFVVTILETHKTAGAAFHIARDLERIRDGVYGGRVELRRGDNLGEVQVAFNEMSTALAERAAVDIAELEHAASVAARITSPPEAQNLARILLDLADERRGPAAAQRS